MRAKHKNGLARKGSIMKTVTIVKNNGIAKDANEKITVTRRVIHYTPRMNEIYRNNNDENKERMMEKIIAQNN